MTRKGRSALVNAWESLQVEFHGSFSVERVVNLAQYANDTSWLHILVVLVVTPIPGLAMTLLIDMLPLTDPAGGLEANKMFFLREYFTYVVLTFFSTNQFRTGVSILSYPLIKLFRDSIVVAAVMVGIIYGVSRAVGFPFPFSFLLVCPLWFTMIAISLAVQWTSQLRSNATARKMLLDMVKLWLCDALLAFTYPVYYYVFTTLPSKEQMAFTLLLPVIKLAMRNLFVRAAAYFKDDRPAMVIFNAEVFNALFVSYCMQSSPSIWTTLELMMIEVILTSISLRDMNRTRLKLRALESQIDRESKWSDPLGPTDTSYTKKLTTLERASTFLQEQVESNVTLVSPFVELKPSLSRSELHADGPQLTAPTKKPLSNNFLVAPKRIHPLPTKDKGPKAIFPAEKKARTLPLGEKYSRKVRKLLYMAEFLILLNYIEVAIPLVYSIYLVATFNLPNRQFYPLFNHMDQSQLIKTLDNVMIYFLFQLFSLLVLVYMLNRLLRISTIHQLAFVLEKQVNWVQICLVFWLLYNVQASLLHSGYDYTFKFAWLTQGASDKSNGDV